MPATSITKAKGLYTNDSYFSEVPEGSASVANNVIIDKAGIIESRRGFRQYGTLGTSSADVLKQILTYKDRILVHYSNKIAFDNGFGTFTEFSNIFTEADTGLRVKYVEQNGNLYLTTANGIMKISASNTSSLASSDITPAGGLKATSGTAKPNYTLNGFLEAYSKCAYRIVWGIKDNNNNLILGVPSMPIEVVNQTDDSCITDVTFYPPSNVTTDYFYRIYRTAVFTATNLTELSDTVVNDEFYLVYEDSYNGETSFTITDIVTESYRKGGTPLYTNANSGEGILQANEAPPFAKDISTYKNSTFYANTRTKHRLSIDMIGADPIRINTYTDSVKIVSIVGIPGSPVGNIYSITFNTTSPLVANQQVLIKNSGTSDLDGLRTVTYSEGNLAHISVTSAIGTASVSNTTIYASSVSVNKNSTTDVYYFVGKPEINTLTVPAYYSGINGKYFILYSTNDETKYVVYFHDTALTDTPPTVSQSTNIKVAVSSGNTSAIVAEKIATALVANSFDFQVSQLGNVLTLINSQSGSATDPLIATPLPVTGLSSSNIQNGETEDVSLKYIKISSLESPSQRIDDVARSFARIVNNSSAGYFTYYLSSVDDKPGKLVIESSDVLDVKLKLFSNTDATGKLFSPIVGTGLVNASESETEAKANRVYYSKTNQPESVPLVNYFDVGPQDRKIVRILGLRDSLFILKEEGIYRLSGESPSNFSVIMFDSSVSITAPDTCVIMNNQIYGLSNQGVVRISDTGVDIISGPIDDRIKKAQSPRYVNYKTASFGCSYTEDMSYYLFVPLLDTDTTGTIAYRFNATTQIWTTMTKTGNAKCAFVDPITTKMFIGPDDVNIIEIERKELLRTDFADRQYLLNIVQDGVGTNTLKLNTTANVKKGDVLLQTQRVSIAGILRLSNKLSRDTGLPIGVDKTFYSNFTINPGEKLQTRLSQLITQLNTDISSSFPTIFSDNFNTFAVEFDALIDLINANLTLNFNNYLKTQTGAEFETIVTDVNHNTNIVTISVNYPFVMGDIYLFKAIPCEYEYNPHFFGDPGLLKQVSEATVMFLSAGIETGSVLFRSDISGDYEGVVHQLEGSGIYGGFIFGEVTFGGEGSGRPFRTYIPKKKQRCRYIYLKYEHSVAFDDFKVLGISFKYRVIGPRAYK